MSLQPSLNNLQWQAASALGFQASSLWNFVMWPASGGNAAENESWGSGAGDWLASAVPGLKSVLEGGNIGDALVEAIMVGLVQAVNIPWPSFETENTAYNFTYISGYQPGGDVNMTFLETNGMSIFSYFYRWMFGHIYNKDLNCFGERSRALSKNQKKTLYTTTSAATNEIYRDGLLTLYTFPMPKLGTSSGGAAALLKAVPMPTAFFYFRNLMVKKIGDMSMSYDSGDAMKIEVTFSCDEVIPKTLL